MTTGNDFGGGVNRLLEGMAFSLGLILVIVAGAARTMVLTALRQDPARPSSIVLTTLIEVVGFFGFLGIVTLLSSTLWRRAA